MNKITAGIIAGCALLVSGCTTVQPQPQQPAPVDVEPVLVGKSVSARLQESEIEINNQLGLLYRVNSGKRVGAYTVLAHNNDLDARLGSSMTIPQAYAKETVGVKQDKNWTATPMPSRYVPLQDNVEEFNPLLKKVKKIEWSNNSLNKLVKNINAAINAEAKNPSEQYNLVFKSGQMADVYISFTAEDMTLEQVIDKLKKEMANFADISLVKENKTFNIIYK